MDLFICHAPSDARTASKLALDLLKRGHNVWIDQPNPEDDPVGPEARYQSMLEGIDNADAFVLVLSPTATTSPQLFEQLDLALERGKRIICAMRQQTLLTRNLEARLKGVEEIDIGRSAYDEGLRQLLKLLGVQEPDAIVNDIISMMEVENWLPGKWNVKFFNPQTLLDGWGVFEFGADGVAEGEVKATRDNETVMLRVVGSWQVLDNRFTVQGWSQMAMTIEEAPLPRHMTYVLSLRVVELRRGEFHGISSIGDRVIFRKIEA